MSTPSRRLTRQDCAALRAQLTNLGDRHVETETPEPFARRLYPVSEHLRAMDASVVLVLGPQGSGKSALFTAFFTKNYPLANALTRWSPRPSSLQAQLAVSHCVAAFPSSTAFPSFHVLAKWVDSEETARKFWEAVLLRLLADRLAPHRRGMLRPILAPPTTDVGAILSAYDSMENTPATALDELEGDLQRSGHWIFAAYDDLDTVGGYDWALMVRMLRGLVAFWSDRSRQWKRIRAKIFLRSDLYRRHAAMGTTDSAKLALSRADLTWSDGALLGMLVKRIANSSHDLAAYCRSARVRLDHHDILGLVPNIRQTHDALTLLERLTGEFMGEERKKGSVRNWILAHLRDGNRLISPRNLVQLFEHAAGEDATNRALSPPRLIHPAALRKALPEVSDSHVTQSISSGWPWLAGVRARLQQDPLVPWERERIADLLATDWDATWGSGNEADIRPPVDRPEDFVDYMSEIGVFRWRSDDRVDVPDLYLSGLNLRRKGGVRRRDRDLIDFTDAGL